MKQVLCIFLFATALAQNSEPFEALQYNCTNELTTKVNHTYSTQPDGCPKELYSNYDKVTINFVYNSTKTNEIATKGTLLLRHKLNTRLDDGTIPLPIFNTIPFAFDNSKNNGLQFLSVYIDTATFKINANYGTGFLASARLAITEENGNGDIRLTQVLGPVFKIVVVKGRIEDLASNSVEIGAVKPNSGIRSLSCSVLLFLVLLI
jgi:hypothetical protein